VSLSRGDAQFVPQAAQFEAVLEPSGGAVVAGAEDVLVPDGNRTHVVPATGGALADYRSDL
jgi:hypothetical protein